MSGRRSRSKGARTERSIVNALQAKSIAAVRVPLSVQPVVASLAISCCRLWAAISVLR
jgi:Holliday junction resolvase